MPTRTLPRSPRKPLTWSAVYRCLLTDMTRSTVLDALRVAGGDPASFMTSRSHRLAVVEAMTKVEDWMELTHPKNTVERRSIRDVRRVLEVEMYP